MKAFWILSMALIPFAAHADITCTDAGFVVRQTLSVDTLKNTYVLKNVGIAERGEALVKVSDKGLRIVLNRPYGLGEITAVPNEQGSFFVDERNGSLALTALSLCDVRDGG